MAGWEPNMGVSSVQADKFIRQYKADNPKWKREDHKEEVERIMRDE